MTIIVLQIFLLQQIGLQAELEAACKELNCVKSKLKGQEAELGSLRLKHSDKEDDYNFRYSKILFKNLLQLDRPNLDII